MSIEYIRKHYGCSHKIGDQVKIRNSPELFKRGQVGKLIRAKGSYLTVKGASWCGNFHPNDVLPVEKAHNIGAVPQPEERNFCPRCGKRTADLTVIHTCTPPKGKI